MASGSVVEKDMARDHEGTETCRVTRRHQTLETRRTVISGRTGLLIGTQLKISVGKASCPTLALLKSPLLGDAGGDTGHFVSHVLEFAHFDK